MIERACPECGWVHELLDTMDAYPPIPLSAWPERWSIHDGEGRGLMFCPRCETPVEDFDLPDYPWKTEKPAMQEVIEANIGHEGESFQLTDAGLRRLSEIANRKPGEA